MDKLCPDVFISEKKILTKNLVPGFRSFSEELVEEGGEEFRVWDPYHSKAAAAIAKGLKTFPIKKGTKILYLGIANGNTSSFLSDIIGPEGIIYGIEVSERSIRDLNTIAARRKNIIPILGNAKLPQSYDWIETVDVIFQDVATDDQTEILIRNAKLFLKERGYALLSLKSRSIDVTKNPENVYRKETEKLKKTFRIIEKKRLDPFELDHCFIVMKKKD